MIQGDLATGGTIFTEGTRVIFGRGCSGQVLLEKQTEKLNTKLAGLSAHLRLSAAMRALDAAFNGTCLSLSRRLAR